MNVFHTLSLTCRVCEMNAMFMDHGDIVQCGAVLPVDVS